MTGPRLPTKPHDSANKDRISSHEFSRSALNESSVDRGVREYRGSAKLVPEWRGLITAQLHGGRIIRG